MTSTIWRYPLINESLRWNYTKMRGKKLGLQPLQRPFWKISKKKLPRKHGLWTRFAKLMKNICSCKLPNNIKIAIFLMSYMSCDQIWLYLLIDGYHCGYTTKEKKKKPWSQCVLIPCNVDLILILIFSWHIESIIRAKPNNFIFQMFIHVKNDVKWLNTL
jgi:hypothetical protein